MCALALYGLFESYIPDRWRRYGPLAANLFALALVGFLLTIDWLPLGPDKGVIRNILFVGLLIGGLLLSVQIFQRFLYVPLLRICLAFKAPFLAIPVLLVGFGACVWLGFDRVAGVVPQFLTRIGISEKSIRESAPWTAMSAAFPGLGREFMPPLDEGSYLYMPS
ncbi:MAG: AcrB/AcrD/AcrF family protein, partial [Burkholderiales bacterium]|nr:AcrB/AcrD/AcrF family protein [Burkholderiales bacterium]